MTAAARASATNIDPISREIAQSLARQSGLSLDEWIAGLMGAAAEGAQRLETPAHPADAASDLAAAMSGLNQRLDAIEARAPAGGPRMDENLQIAIERLVEAGREQVAVAARFEGAVAEIGGAQSRLAERLRRLEAEGATPRSTEALRALEASLGKMAGHLYEGEGRTREAIEDLTSKMRRVEAGEGGSSKLADRLADLALRLEEAQGRTRGAIDAVGERLTVIGERLDGVEIASLGAASTERLEAIETRTAEVLAGLGDSLAGLDARLDGLQATMPAPTADRLGEIEARTAEVLAGLGESLAGLDARIDGLQAAIPAPVTERLGEIEARTAQALAGVGEALAGIDVRLDGLQAAMPAPNEERLEQIEARTAVALRTLDNSLAFLGARLGAVEVAQAVAQPEQLEGLQRGIAEVGEQVREAEGRSREAVERMGREVVDLSASLVRRVEAAETRGAEAIEELGGEIARVAEGVDTRLSRADTVQAQALERLGDEIARISERLAERIATADRRSAQAIEEVGDQMARVTERLSQRHERTSEDLSERIRLSEERTGRVLAETRDLIETMSAARRRAADLAVAADEDHAPLFGEDPFAGFAPPAPAAEIAVASEAAFSQEDLDLADRFPAGDLDQAEPAPIETDAQAATAVDAAPFEPPPFVEPDSEPDSEPVGFEAGPSAEASDGSDDDNIFAELAPFAEPPLLAESPPLADASPFAEKSPFAEAAPAAPAADPEATVAHGSILSTREAVAQARASALASGAPPRATFRSGGGGSLFSGRSFGARNRTPNMGATALGFGLAAAFGLALGGFWFIESGPDRSISGQLGQLLPGRAPAAGPIAQGSAAQGGAGPRLAMALGADARSRALAPNEDLPAVYAGAVTRLASHDPHGLDDLRRIADLGYGPAEFYLAKLYETGGEGVRKDSFIARLWTQRAAQAGDARAMHNLALDLFEGVGGPKDIAQSADWFGRAAALGLPDSQYNLGRLYETGLGVEKNPAEAYKWYLIAARSGDAQSQAGAARSRSDLSAEARAAAERSAAAFHPAQGGNFANSVAAAAPPNAVAAAQKALSALGYYQGPTDGQGSPALRLALNAYQTDEGLPASGAPDPATLAKLTASGH